MRFLTLLFLYLPILSTGLYAQTPIDYSQAQNWAALPQQLPVGLAQHCTDTSLWAKADVFYVYPTLNIANSDKRWNVPLDDDIRITDADGNIGPRTQFKSVIGIGLSYKIER